MARQVCGLCALCKVHTWTRTKNTKGKIQAFSVLEIQSESFDQLHLLHRIICCLFCSWKMKNANCPSSIKKQLFYLSEIAYRKIVKKITMSSRSVRIIDLEVNHRWFKRDSLIKLMRIKWNRNKQFIPTLYDPMKLKRFSSFVLPELRTQKTNREAARTDSFRNKEI